MLINMDVKSLEVCVAADMAKDKIMIQEITERQDMHKNNQDALGLPSRLIAKVFIFRLLFGGSAYSYANDLDFAEVGYSEKQWQEVIDSFYKKYSSIASWHKRIIDEVMRTGKLVSPLNGRYFPFKPDRNSRGELKWPITQIKNYLIQAGGADLVKLSRLRAAQLLAERGLEAKLISTVHDSIVASCPSKNTYEVGKILLRSVEELPQMCKKVWNYDLAVPMTAEVQFGPNKFNMQDLKI